MPRLKPGKDTATFEDERKNFLPKFNGQESGTPNDLRLEDSTLGNISATETIPEPKRVQTMVDPLAQLEAAYKAFGSGANPRSQSGRTLTPASIPSLPRFLNPRPMAINFEDIDRNLYLERAFGLVEFISNYYGVSPAEINSEMDRLKEETAENLVLAVNGYEFAAQHVRVICDASFVREITFFEDITISKFFAKNGIAEDVLDRSTSADEVSKLVSGTSTTKQSRRSFS